MLRKLLLFFLLAAPWITNGQQKDTAAALQQVQIQLNTGTGIQQILIDSRWMFVHPNTSFRQLMQEFATAPELTIINPSEAGKKITITGFVKDKNGNGVAGARVYCYQTDNRGFYAFDTTHVFGNEGDRRHARLFGYLKTDKEGRFIVHTIHPVGYPKSLLPSHIHCEVMIHDFTSIITELLFDEDPRLTAEARTRSAGEGFYIAKGVNDSYTYQLTVKL